MSVEKKKVLIIDDEPDTIIFLTNWLEDNGYSACSATDGNQGMQVIRCANTLDGCYIGLIRNALHLGDT